MINWYVMLFLETYHFILAINLIRKTPVRRFLIPSKSNFLRTQNCALHMSTKAYGAIHVPSNCLMRYIYER